MAKIVKIDKRRAKLNFKTKKIRTVQKVRFGFYFVLAESEGFEPPVTLLPRRFSRPLLSATQPALHSEQRNLCYATLYLFPAQKRKK